MRNLNELDKYRVRTKQVALHYGHFGDDTCGVFAIKSERNGQELFIIASAGEGWDHVSVSKHKKTPSWAEMEQVKRLFFLDDEVAFQLHVPPSKHISIHDNCLHIWRPHGVAIPMPPSRMVGYCA